MIRFGEEEAHIRMAISRSQSAYEIDMHLKKNRPKGIAVNGVPIRKAAKEGKFLSKDDFRDRTKVSKTVIDLMDDLGILGDLPESNQLSLFDLVG